MKYQQQARKDHFQEVTDSIIAALEAGTKPWARPWDPDLAGGPQAPFYHGINVLLLGMSPLAFCSGDPRWMTYQQAQEKKWQVRKGEKSTTIFFYKPLQIENKDRDEGDPETKKIGMLRTYAVFHASQIDAVPGHKAPSVDEAPWTRPEAANIILTNSQAVIRIGGDRAFYSPSTDHIQLPPECAFNGPHEWVATALHELGHWTGHATRLDRDIQNRFGTPAYAAEELRAELASAFVGSMLGIPADIPNHASYLASWIKKLKEDKREIFRAAADAQRIADYVLAFHPDYAATLAPAEENEPAEIVPTSILPRPANQPLAGLTA